MKKIWHFLKNHLQEDFDWKLYSCVGALLTILLAINYSIDLEDGYLDYLTGFIKFFSYFLLYSVSYYSAVWIYTFFKGISVFDKKEFWIKSIFGLVVLSIDSSIPFLQFLVQHLFPEGVFYWAYKVSANMISFFTVFFPIIIFHYLFERTDRSIYGLQPRQFDPRPYLIMLAIMLPFLIAASGTDAFQRQYPMYKTSTAHSYMGVNEAVTVSGYELAYGLDFITVEFLFRGFFVLSLASLLGRGSVLCMAVIYCTLHFGKPMGEAVSSIFGGFILGTVAFETRSIWGGVIVHVGLAWTMEFLAFIQKHF